MGSKSSIEWTDATWTPIRVRSADGERVGWGCEKVSDGCKNCYAETLNKRLGMGLPYAVGAVTKAGGEYFLDEKMLTAPLRWRKPRRVFVCSMTDLFGEWVPDEWIDRMFAVMALTPQHTYQVLTKRPERMRRYLTTRDTPGAVAITIREVAPDGGLAAMQAMGTHVLRDVVQRRWPLPNVWLGTSAEDQGTADVRIPELLATPAAVRFVSYEPALSVVDFRPWLHDSHCWDLTVADEAEGSFRYTDDDDGPCICSEPREVHIDWIIVGGESGPGARPFDVAWARSTVAQCKAAGVACFVKQLGAKPVSLMEQDDDFPRHGWNRNQALKLKSRKGGDMEEWPEDLRVREMPLREAVSRD